MIFIEQQTSEAVTWQWFQDGGSPLVGEFNYSEGTAVLELDKDFTVGEALEMISEFHQRALMEVGY